MKLPFILLITAICLSACTKNDQASEETVSPGNGFVEYLIEKGSHFSNNSPYKTVELSEMKFVVKFDSSAIYQTIVAANQYDINKLFGFADNGADHHEYSARFGWRWSDNALRLFAYIYNAGAVTFKEIGVFTIGTEIQCSIKPGASKYIFTAGDQTVEMPRLSSTDKAKGYLLYPFFGGDETAPHAIKIMIKTL